MGFTLIKITWPIAWEFWTFFPYQPFTLVSGIGFVFIYPVRFLGTSQPSVLENSQHLSLQIGFSAITFIFFQNCYWIGHWNLSSHPPCLLTALFYVSLCCIPGEFLTFPNILFKTHKSFQNNLTVKYKTHKNL